MQNVKGTYDYFGNEQALRRKVQETMRGKFELYGFDEMALNPGIELPFKRYEMGKVFRDGPVKRGRLREFLQCDVDVVGVRGPEAEVELMQLAVDVFRTLKLDIQLRWNNRRFLGEVLAAIGIPDKDSLSAMLTIDKLAKIGEDGVKEELIAKGLAFEMTESIMNLIAMEELTLDAVMDKYELQNSMGAQETIAVRDILRKLGLERVCAFDPFLSRGLSFYTGTVYEIFDASNGFSSSLGGGGRYDAIIGQLIGRDDVEYGAVGLSFGMESIMALLEERKAETASASASIVLIPIGVTAAELLQTAAELRAGGIRVKMDTSGRKLKNILASVANSGIRYALLVGDTEWRVGLVRLKDMEERLEREMSIDEVIYILADK